MCLEKAGAEVLAFKEFGDYQGSWYALVKYKGETGIASGGYGSCSGCDSFQAEFDWSSSDPHEIDGKYYKSYYADADDEITKEEYDDLIKGQDERYAIFGEKYLRGLYDEQRAEKLRNKTDDDWFDSEELDIVNWALGLNW